jgi:hypothetical protein
LVTARDAFSRLQVRWCTAKKVLFEDAEVLPDIGAIKIPTSPRNMTNNDFDRGVGRHSVAIVVENGADARARLLPGVVVKFGDGTPRMIASQTENADNLILQFLGPAFDADKAGFPRPFEIQR